MQQAEFDVMIGRLDHLISQMVDSSKVTLTQANERTLIHHAEDMVMAGIKILSDLEKNDSLVMLRVLVDSKVKV